MRRERICNIIVIAYRFRHAVLICGDFRIRHRTKRFRPAPALNHHVITDKGNFEPFGVHSLRDEHNAVLRKLHHRLCICMLKELRFLQRHCITERKFELLIQRRNRVFGHIRNIRRGSFRFFSSIHPLRNQLQLTFLFNGRDRHHFLRQRAGNAARSRRFKQAQTHQKSKPSIQLFHFYLQQFIATLTVVDTYSILFYLN